ncbi:MAG: alpha-glucan family phosphorylase [Deltaproteobacteria bacterium]|nr:alpha-glucan family phosphorylase [Deltaproteobacteria bacterium]
MSSTQELYDKLMEIAFNYWCGWQPEVVEIFSDLDIALWREVRHNPVAFLKRLGMDSFSERVHKQAIESRIIYAYHRLQEYMAPQRGWGGVHAGPLKVRPVAYFSAEFGLHESLPIYSGGLGVLAGDHLKSASDLGVPLVGVGLFYDQGYFRQQIDAQGWQQETYGRAELDMLPVERLCGPDGQVLTVQVETSDDTLHASLLKVQVGRSLLMLLDPGIEDNVPDDQRLTEHLERLYGGGRRERIRQELLLGVGGLRALRAMGIEPGVLHLNEGHCAFAPLEAARQAMQEQGMGFAEALEYVAPRCVFTTHTPVEAGHDRFAPEMVCEHLGPLREQLGIDEKTLLGLGRVDPENDAEPFCMTVLALKTTQRANGVSAIHGSVSRRMWQPLWPGRRAHEVPIGHITNGVHVASWLAPEMRRLYVRHLGRDWAERIRRREVWQGILGVDDGELWETHRFLKGKLVEFVRRRLLRQAGARSEPADSVARRVDKLDPDCLTIGFARRFALYKRAWLLLQDEAWLERCLTDPERPVQLIFAGKAHPMDERGKELIQRIFRLSRDPRFEGHLFLVEDYDINVGRHLVQGVDVWLNNPRRPLEACGTSGQKVVLNGGLNCSTLDGWWAEAYDGHNGFAIGSGLIHRDEAEQDKREAEQLRRVIELELVPLFYARDESGLPREWIARIKHALVSLACKYNADRMVVDYAEQAYLPASGGCSSALPDEVDLDLTSLVRWIARKER